MRSETNQTKESLLQDFYITILNGLSVSLFCFSLAQIFAEVCMTNALYLSRRKVLVVNDETSV